MGQATERAGNLKVYQLRFNRILGLTQNDIASLVGCSQSLISLGF
jgi:predicted transcriptional regulator